MEAGLGAVRFELEVRDAGGKAIERAWTRAELEKPVTAASLKRMNAKGHEVFIRPAGDNGLVLVDELKAEGVDRLKRSGFAPAVTLETSPGVYQAWVKLADQALSAEGRAVAAQWFARELGSTAFAGGEPYGRLAGFTNWQRVQDGQPP